MTDVNKLKKEIVDIDNQKLQLLDAMKSMEEARSIGNTLKEELDNLKKMTVSQDRLQPNQEVITWHKFEDGEPECPIKRPVLIMTKDKQVMSDTLTVNMRNYIAQFNAGVPKKDVVAWADLPKGCDI